MSYYLVLWGEVYSVFGEPKFFRKIRQYRFFAIIKRKRNCTYSMNRTITYLISDKDAGFTIEQNLRHRGYSAKNITQFRVGKV